MHKSSPSNKKSPATQAVRKSARTIVPPREKSKAVPSVSTTSSISARNTKQARLISLLRAKPGATMEQMTTLTGWQAHTVRGTISGILRKKLGYQVTCSPGPEAGASLYRIAGSKAAA